MTPSLPNVTADTPTSQITELTDNAVKAALLNKWDDAIRLNLLILKTEKNNIDALNRLGFAYIYIRKIEEAKKMFQKVKKLDPYNPIASKNLSKLDSLKTSDYETDNGPALASPMLFLEEPGKTKLVQCINVAPVQILSNTHCGQEVYLNPKNHCVEIRDTANRYLGALPDDLSFRLIKFLNGKNTYRVYVKSIDKKSITIFIREIGRGKKFATQPSFASSQLLQTYSRDFTAEGSVSEEKPNTAATGEGETEEQTE